MATAKSLKIPISQATKTAAEAKGVSESAVKKNNKREVIKFTQSDKNILTTPGKHSKSPDIRNYIIDYFDIYQTNQPELLC